MDASFLEALLKKDHEKHEIAHQIVLGILDNYRICVSMEEYAKVFDIFKEYEIDFKDKIRRTLVENVTIFSPEKKQVVSALKIFNDYHQRLSYSDCIVVEYFKENDIHHIISFDDKWDYTDEVKRVKGINNHGLINIPKA